MLSWFSSAETPDPETPTVTKEVSVIESTVSDEPILLDLSFENFVSELKNFRVGSLKKTSFSEPNLKELNKDISEKNVVSELKNFRRVFLKKVPPQEKEKPKRKPFEVELEFHRNRILKLSDVVVMTSKASEVQTSLLENKNREQNDRIKDLEDHVFKLQTELSKLNSNVTGLISQIKYSRYSGKSK